MLEDLTKELEQPNDLLQLTQDLLFDFNELEEDDLVVLNAKSLDELNALVLDELQAAESSVESQVEKINAIDESVQSNLASIERCKRKHADAIEHCQTLLDGLPPEVSEDASPETGVNLDALNAQAEAWMLDNNKSIEDDAVWRNIRRDWLEDLENPEKSTLQDLETMYTQMVNVEGVTTSFAGKFAWYNQHLKAPFDIVIIDEIGKATPPEILLPDSPRKEGDSCRRSPPIASYIQRPHVQQSKGSTS